ncbi:ATP-binding protein [Leptospira sp. 'Mane']|uniref:ATP-binding protein n=1 Tax=Leptospira sp. 'Mane' TaxID=3387407 RepID=UPI00398B8C51
MKYKLSKKLRSHFESILFRIGKESLASLQKIKAVVSYSGGQDSTLVLFFYEYLHKEYGCPSPFVFHLNHEIRNNSDEETQMETFIRSRFSDFLFVKKKSLNLLFN